MELWTGTCCWRVVRLVAMGIWLAVVRELKLMTDMCQVDEVGTLTGLGTADVSPSYTLTYDD